MTRKNMTREKIMEMSYNELIGFVKETNRPPGGRNSILHLIQRAMINSQSKILEIGTSTGTTALEIGRLVQCSITAIDINEESLMEARKRANLLQVHNINFTSEDATNMPFSSESFDMVFCGNVLSIIPESIKAFNECIRVAKYNGYLAVIPMYYIDTPSEELVNKVRDAIQVNIPINYKKNVLEFYNHDSLEIIDCTDFRFDNISESTVREFVANIMERDHLKQYEKDVIDACYEKYLECMLLFRENLSHMGYSTILLRKTRFIEDPELFLGHKIL